MSYAALHPHIRQTAERELTPKQLRILQDRLNGHSTRDIAITLDIDESTVRGHYRRATQKLARFLKEEAA